jgi:hypothetical protein
MAKSQQQQLNQQAGQERAMSQRQLINERRQQNLVSSKATAQIAAGGGDITDAGSQDILAGIEQEGTYRALTALYTGEEKAKGLEYEGLVKRAEGKAAKKAGVMNAFGTLASTAGSIYGAQAGGASGGDLFSKYGGRNLTGGSSGYGSSTYGNSMFSGTY